MPPRARIDWLLLVVQEWEAGAPRNSPDNFLAREGTVGLLDGGVESGVKTM